MRWKVVCVGLAAALVVTAGCKQQCFVSEEDLNKVVSETRCNLAKDPTVGSHPTIDQVGAPPTVNDPDRKVRYISLAEAISIALEHGTVGVQEFTTNGGGSYIDSEITFTGRGVSSTDAIRVLALDPAAVGSNIDLALSKFDALWTTSMTWNGIDQPLAVPTFATAGATVNEEETAQFSTAILKPLPTGGVAGITFNTNYTLQSPSTNTGASINPAYQPALQFEFEQPLLQGFGVEINQLRQSNPVSELLPNGGALSALPQPGVEGILVTRIRFDQQRAEFQRNVNIMLGNVEFTYWNLYFAYWNLYAQEAALRQAYEAWKIAEVKLQAGKIAVADVAQARGQYELFRSNRLAALDSQGGLAVNAGPSVGVIEAERELRGMLGMRVEDGCRLVPSDAPTLAEFHPDWCTAWQEAMQNAPSLILARQQLKADQLNVILAENSLLPDLRFGATYDVNSLGSRLDGDNTGPTGNAFRNLASNGFNDYSLFLRLNVPIGYRNAYANVRIAKLQVARDYENLHEQELKIELALGRAYQTIFISYEQIKALRAQRVAFGEQVKANFQEFQAGKITPDVLLEAQRFWASALSQEYEAIRDYNDSLAAFELTKGTIAQHDNVVIAEGALPTCVAERAVEHQRKRSDALEVRERAVPVPLAETHCDHPIADVPTGVDSHTVPLPELWQNMPPLKDAPSLPPPVPAAASAANASTSPTAAAPAPGPWLPMPAAPATASLPVKPAEPLPTGAPLPILQESNPAPATLPPPPPLPGPQLPLPG